MKLLIRNLDRSINEATLREMFESYGMVQSCNLVLDKQTHASKGFGFVEMPKVGEAKAAMQALNASNIGGKILRVKKAEAKPATPKRETSDVEADKKVVAESIWGKRKKRS